MMDPEHSKERERDEAFEDAAKKLFEDSVGRLDERTRTRLGQARARALDGQRDRHAARDRWLWLPAGAAAAAAVFLLVWYGGSAPEAELHSVALGDLEILLGDEDLELFEDFEFYTWLEEHPELSLQGAADDGVG